MNIFGSNNIRQGIPEDVPNSHVTDEINLDEYEEYTDPNCGCRKIRKKKSKIEENETDVKIQSEQVRTEDGTGITKTRRSKKS